MAPEKRAAKVFSEHEFTWREGAREHHEAVIAKAIRGAVAAEREACAKVAEAKRAEWDARALAPEGTRDINPENARIAGIAAGQIAMAIRDRNKQEG